MIKMFALVKISLIFVFINHVYAFDQSHKDWDEIIKGHTSKEHSQILFNYKKLKNNDEKLNQYLKKLSEVSKEEFKSFSKNAQLAFWINTYNAFTVKLILNHFPVKSIKDTGSFFSSPWKKKFFKIFGEKISLDGIEHGIIRKEFKEPRIHFAVNCASIGCPSLLQEAFVKDQLERQFDRAAKNFVLNKNKNYYDKKSKTLYLSKIFQWYGADFDEKHQSAQAYVQGVLKLDKSVVNNVRYLDYDWSLNHIK